MRYLFFIMLLITGLIFANDDKAKAKVTFIELGSTGCTPCQKMKVVMESLEKIYGDQLEIIFYDTKTPKGKADGSKYRIRMIPTQVFLDEDGKEFHRHEGYYPQKRIEELLATKGLAPLDESVDEENNDEKSEDEE